jgi:DNA-binding Lrp family transcriptional regulator
MIAKSQDVVIALKLCTGNAMATYAELGRELGMSASETHACVRRLAHARLVEPDTKRVRREPLINFLVHGVPYAFPAIQKSDVTRGMLTAWAAPVMEGNIIVVSGSQLGPVWPDPEGAAQGTTVKPLYPSVPHAARADKNLYDLLALVDALRIGRARERQFAEKEIRRRLCPT